MFSPDFLREMQRGEEPAVDALLAHAFGGQDEVKLIAKLRKSRAMAGEMVLPSEHGIIGYLALSKMIAPKNWLCLAPVAIHPDVQRMGYGRRMVGMITEWAKMTNQTLVVLGDPVFYQRCGFRTAPDGLTSPYPVDHTLVAGPAKAKSLELRYPQAFG